MAQVMNGNQADKHCTGNCMMCSLFQRQYCASQISYNNMLMINQLAQAVEALSQKVEAIQSNEGTLFNPIDTTQEASGVENRLPR